MTHHAGRWGPSGQVANELESVLTAVVSSADEIADGELTEGWRLQQELGALESALTTALSLVQRLGAFAREARPGPAAPLRLEDFAVGPVTPPRRMSGTARPTPVFAGTVGDLALDA